MAGLDYSSVPVKSSAAPQRAAGSKEKAVPIQLAANDNAGDTRGQQKRRPYTLESFQRLCPPGGAESAVLYTTTLRGVRQTFEACNTVRAAVEAAGMCVRERDVSMDSGFREELRELTKGIGVVGPAVPRLFVKGSGSRKLVVVVAGEEWIGVPQWAGNAKGRKRATAKVVRCISLPPCALLLANGCSQQAKVQPGNGSSRAIDTIAEELAGILVIIFFFSYPLVAAARGEITAGTAANKNQQQIATNVKQRCSLAAAA
uniref:Glutaredoxin domain-containing protein n=1 Tax=Ananas comosus var. bracteatus TaxID=296719 RepID=A0A6V7PY18_ANACO|nr:unnamed protein product [Ananas comosus var. bracteatus]